MAAVGAPSHPQLINGAVVYRAEDGTNKSITVGRQCVDLWVAPDESVIAFIAVDKSDGTDEGGGPFILMSSIYTARKAENFTPKEVTLGTVRDGNARVWEVFRTPSVSPDGRIIYFFVPAGITSGFMVAHDLKTHRNELIGGRRIIAASGLGGLLVPFSQRTDAWTRPRTCSATDAT